VDGVVGEIHSNEGRDHSGSAAGCPSYQERSDLVLVGPRFRLVPFLEEHISGRYIDWLNDPEINRFLEARFVDNNYQSVLAYVRSFYGDTEKYMWGIYPAREEEPIGTITLSLVNRNHGSGTIGLLIGEKQYWGTGASTEALEMLAECTFGTLGLRRLHAETCSLNYGINFTFKKLGFTFEGTMRKSHLLSSGDYADGYRWGLLQEEWRARNQGGLARK